MTAKEKKKVIVYSIFMFTGESITFTVDRWEGTEGKTNYKLYHCPEDGRDTLRDGSKLVPKSSLEQISIFGNCASVKTMNPESIEDWKQKLVEQYQLYLAQKVKFVQEQSDRFVQQMVKWQSEKYK